MKVDFTRVLPENCMSLIISLTSPQDACQSAQVSKVLRSAANSDSVWETFLPCDYKEIVSGSLSSPPSPTSLLSKPKKDLYILLSKSILIENGTKSFQLEKESGKKCYRLGARALSIIWGDTPQYWEWTSLPGSRFSEVAVLNKVWWLDIKGKIETRTLSFKTNYAAYLIFKLASYTYGLRRIVGLHVNVEGSDSWKVRYSSDSGKVRYVVLDPPRNLPKLARERGDGWMEIEMGEFFNEWGDDGTLEFSLRQVDCSYSKEGLIIEGIELRPKETRN